MAKASEQMQINTSRDARLQVDEWFKEGKNADWIRAETQRIKELRTNREELVSALMDAVGIKVVGRPLKSRVQKTQQGGGRSEAAKTKHDRANVLRMLKRTKQSSAADLAKLTKVKYIPKHLNKLVELGQASKVKHGLYKATGK